MRASIWSAILLLTITATLSSAAPPQQGAPKAPPIAEAGRLGMPRSPKQVGLPLGAIRATIPADNPQTPEKIQLG
jgi:hypothetical protein